MYYNIIRLIDKPEIKDKAAEWFHAKWGIPLEAYRESMEECLRAESPVPQWYVAMENDYIIGGMGVIENDFHDRKDCAQCLCGLHGRRETGQRRGRGTVKLCLFRHEREGNFHALSSDRPYFFL